MSTVAVRILHQAKVPLQFIAVVVHSLICPTLCNPMTWRMSGFSVLHYLPEFAQIHVHWVDDAIQPSHPLQPLIFSYLQSFPASGLFSESALHIRWPKYWSFSISPSNEYLGLVSFRIDWFGLIAVQGTLKSLVDKFKSISSSVLSFLYDPTLTSIHDNWKNHSFD